MLKFSRFVVLLFFGAVITHQAQAGFYRAGGDHRGSPNDHHSSKVDYHWPKMNNLISKPDQHDPTTYSKNCTPPPPPEDDCCSTTNGINLGWLIDGHSVTVGDKLFDNFSYLATGNMPGPGLVTVVPYTDSSGNYGLRFVGHFTDHQGDGASDALLDFNVTALDPSRLIIGANLVGTAYVTGGPGIMSVTETFFPDNTTDAISIYKLEPGGSQVSQSITFDHGFRTLHVQKDILGLSADPNGGIPYLGCFTQTFPQICVPEPSSVMLLGLGLVGIIVAGQRRRIASRR